MKASLLITLRRISVHSTRMRRAITIVFGLSIFFSFSSFFVVVFQCVPISYGWRLAQPGGDPGVGKCVRMAEMWYAVTSINIIMDFAIWIVPIVMVWQMRNLPLSKKAGMGVLFFLGALWVALSNSNLNDPLETDRERRTLRWLIDEIGQLWPQYPVSPR